jgi:hypothetical protein
MQMEYIYTLITLVVIALQIFIVYKAYQSGKAAGIRIGEDSATLRLLRFKNAEVWDTAHAYDHELQQERLKPFEM